MVTGCGMKVRWHPEAESPRTLRRQQRKADATLDFGVAALAAEGQMPQAAASPSPPASAMVSLAATVNLASTNGANTQEGVGQLDRPYVVDTPSLQNGLDTRARTNACDSMGVAGTMSAGGGRSRAWHEGCEVVWDSGGARDRSAPSCLPSGAHEALCGECAGTEEGEEHEEGEECDEVYGGAWGAPAMPRHPTSVAYQHLCGTGGPWPKASEQGVRRGRVLDGSRFGPGADGEGRRKDRCGALFPFLRTALILEVQPHASQHSFKQVILCDANARCHARTSKLGMM
jgi:hypothetical protein